MTKAVELALDLLHAIAEDQLTANAAANAQTLREHALTPERQWSNRYGICDNARNFDGFKRMRGKHQ